MRKINLKSVKNFAIGLIVGMSILTTGSAYANTISQEKVQAYLNYDISVTYNGKDVALSNAPITYNGKTYLPLTDVGKITKTNVKWNQKEKRVEMTNEVSKRDRSPLYLPDNTIEKYGFKEVYIVDGKEYVNFNLLETTLNKHNLTFKPDIVTQSISLETMDGKVLIEKVETEKVRNLLVVDYNYFLNEIIPLGK